MCQKLELGLVPPFVSHLFAIVIDARGSMKHLRSLPALLAVVLLTFGVAGNGAAKMSNVEIAKQLAPIGKLRVAVLMLSYFANEEAGGLKGWSPDLGRELARRLGVPYEGGWSCGYESVGAPTDAALHHHVVQYHS